MYLEVILMSDMGDRIKYLRERAGLTQEELGEKIGVQKSGIAKYENGRVENIKRSILKTLADALDVTPGYLMFGDEKEKKPAPKNGPKVEELIRLFEGLPEDVQDQLLGLARTLAKSHK